MKELTARQQEICYLTAKGFSDAEMAEKLFVEEKTIKFHLTNIYKELGLKSRAQLIVFMLQSAPTEGEIKEFVKLMSDGK